MKTSTVLKPTMLFAAGAIASTAASAAPTIEDVNYSPGFPDATSITIGNSTTAQYNFKTNLTPTSFEYRLNGEGDSQVTTTSQAAAFYPTANNPALSGSAITGSGMKSTDVARLAGVGDDRYFGLRFKINDDQYTGWAKVNAAGDNISQIGYQLAAGGVPEPSSWALMIAGFGGVGLAMRRRRRQVAVAAVA